MPTYRNERDRRGHQPRHRKNPPADPDAIRKTLQPAVHREPRHRHRDHGKHEPGRQDGAHPAQSGRSLGEASAGLAVITWEHRRRRGVAGLRRQRGRRGAPIAQTDPDTKPDPEVLAQAMRPDLLKAFKPALLGRITVIPYYPLDDNMLKSIIKLHLKKIGDRLRENHRAAFTYDDSLLTTIAGRCKEVESGARNVDHILSGTMLPEMAGAPATAVQLVLGRVVVE